MNIRRLVALLLGAALLLPALLVPAAAQAGDWDSDSDGDSGVGVILGYGSDDDWLVLELELEMCQLDGLPDWLNETMYVRYRLPDGSERRTDSLPVTWDLSGVDAAREGLSAIPGRLPTGDCPVALDWANAPPLEVRLTVLKNILRLVCPDDMLREGNTLRLEYRDGRDQPVALESLMGVKLWCSLDVSRNWWNITDMPNVQLGVDGLEVSGLRPEQLYVPNSYTFQLELPESVRDDRYSFAPRVHLYEDGDGDWWLNCQPDISGDRGGGNRADAPSQPPVSQLPPGPEPSPGPEIPPDDGLDQPPSPEPAPGPESPTDDGLDQPPGDLGQAPFDNAVSDGGETADGAAALPPAGTLARPQGSAPARGAALLNVGPSPLQPEREASALAQADGALKAPAAHLEAPRILTRAVPAAAVQPPPVALPAALPAPDRRGPGLAGGLLALGLGGGAGLLALRRRARHEG